MDPLTILAAAKTTLGLVRLVLGEEEFEAWQEKIETAIRCNVTPEQALRLVEKLATAIGAGSAQMIRMKAAASLNPHAQKHLALAALCLGALGLSGCWASHRVRTVPETPTTVECYAVEWPADASRNPEHYWTEEVDGHLITTVPKVLSGS